MAEIKFGTDGWRAILNKDFTYENTKKVLNGIATYVYKESEFNKKILVGYDPRNKADEFAVYIAEKLAEYGFDIELSDKIVATPVLAYSAMKKNAYAIMLTASHNPPEYLGIKFIPPYGGPAEDEMVKIIVENLDNDFKQAAVSKTYKKVSFDEDYLLHISSLIDFEKIQQSNICVNYDGHHGAAAKLFKYILDKYNIKNNCENLEKDINFGGFMPDPKEKYLPALKAKCIKNGCIGLSNDGDGDRFGVFDEKGNFISANDIIVMLMLHLIHNKNHNGKLAKTVGASCMLDIAAKSENIDVIETPVGFKWLGAAMRKNDVIIAGEESGGLSVKGHIPEKDGIIANLLIIEMIAYSGNKLYDIHSQFLDKFNRLFINDRLDIELASRSEQDKIIEKFKRLESLGKYKIIKKSDLDGLKIYLDDESTLLIRKSGTEPLLRIYIETDTSEKLNVLKTLAKSHV